MGKAVVFVVEDDADVRENLRDLLEDAGHVVSSASDGEEALAQMKASSGPAVAIVDLQMPVMDGRELISAMRKSAELRLIPIIVLTGTGNTVVTGADCVLAKPYESSRLLARVREFAP
ncbi:MAG: response regulator [Polyangiaceae bacterium]